MREAVVSVRVDSDTKKRLSERATQAGVSESDLIRLMIEKELGAVPDGNESDIDSRLPATKDGYERKKITLTVPSFIVDLANERAAKKGMALSRWIAALIQTHVFQPPVSTMTELKLLNANLRELRSIGVNINQIARAFNQGDVDATRLDAITQFQTVLKNNRNIILGLLSSTNRSWGRQWD